MSYKTKAASFEICPAEDASFLAVEAYIRCAALQAAATMVAATREEGRTLGQSPLEVVELAIEFEHHLRAPR